MARTLEMFAQASGISLTQQIREAINVLIEERRQDAAFMGHLRQSIEEQRDILDRPAE